MDLAVPGRSKGEVEHCQTDGDGTGDDLSHQIQVEADPLITTPPLLREVNFSQVRQSPLDSIYHREDSIDAMMCPEDLGGEVSMLPIKMDLFPEFEITYVKSSELGSINLGNNIDIGLSDDNSSNTLEGMPPLIEASPSFADIVCKSSEKSSDSIDLSSPLASNSTADPGKAPPSSFLPLQLSLTDNNASQQSSISSGIPPEPQISYVKKSSKDKELLSCEICGKVFAHKTSLKHHMMRHSGVKPFTCDICNKSFSRQGILAVHLKTHQEPSYCCPFCPKKFKQQASLLLHEKTHTGDRPYKCEHCKKCFSRPNVLQKHLLTHSSTKQFHCDVCSKSFKRADHLLVHKRTHMEKTPYICGLCGHYFLTADNLRRHESSHSDQRNHVCEVCGKAFTKPAYLVEHRKIHGPRKTISCPTCGKQFTSQSLLKQHATIHSDEKPYECVECGNKFRRKGHLQQHMKIHKNSRLSPKN